MGNIIIGILFIIGGLSGQFVMRGTNSSAALVVIGIILVIWGFVKMSKDEGEGSVDSVYVQPAGPKVKFPNVENPSQTINFRAYSTSTKSYLGKISTVNEQKKVVEITNDFGKIIVKKFDKIDVLEQELNS